MNNKRTLVILYKDIVLVTRVCFFCTTLFTNNNIKIVIQMHTLPVDPFVSPNTYSKICLSLQFKKKIHDQFFYQNYIYTLQVTILVDKE